MLRLALFLAVFFVPAASLACGGDVAAADDPIRFVIEYDDDARPFEVGSGWTRDRYETVAARITPDNGRTEPGNPVVYRGLLEQYRLVTGVTVELRLEQELPEFLAERGIEVKDLEYLDAGAQGALFTHPKLGNTLLKVTTTALQNAEYCSASKESKIRLPGGRRFIAAMRLAYDELERLRPTIDPSYLVVLDNQQANIKKQYRGQAKQALHRAQQMILPGLVAGQAGLEYFDFARVTLVGNGFFLREYYPDGEVGNRVVRDLITADGKVEQDLHDALDAVRPRFPVLGEMVPTLVSQAPSYFVSPTLYRSTTSGRRRLFVIYDLD